MEPVFDFPLHGADEPIQYIRENTYDEPIELRPSENYKGMKGVNVYIDVPTELDPYEDEVVISEQGVQCDIHIPETEIVQRLNVISEKINDIHEEYTLSKNTMDMDVVITQINNVFHNYNIDAQFNKIIDMSKTYLTDVQVNNKYVQNIEVELQQVQKKITEINITNVTNALQVTSNNVNILTRDVQALQQLMLKMFGNRFKYNKIEEKWEALEDSPVKRIRCDAASTSTQEPPETDGDIKLLPPPDDDDMDNSLNTRAVKLRRTEAKGGGVSIPTRVTVYNNAMATVDDFNTQYNMDCYGLFEMEVINEIPLLENVPIVINQNYNQGVPFTWNIFRDYIQDPDLNQDYYNPIGAVQFSITVDVPQSLPENVEHNKEVIITDSAGEIILPTSPYTTMDQVTVMPRLKNEVWSTNGVKIVDQGYCGFGISRVAVPHSVQPLTISTPDQVINAPSGTDSDGLNYVGYYPIVLDLNINNVPSTVSIPTTNSYSISDYNNSQDPVTNYVGFSSVICNNYTGYDVNNPITSNGTYNVPVGYSGFGPITFSYERDDIFSSINVNSNGYGFTPTYNSTAVAYPAVDLSYNLSSSASYSLFTLDYGKVFSGGKCYASGRLLFEKNKREILLATLKPSSSCSNQSDPFIRTASFTAATGKNYVYLGDVFCCGYANYNNYDGYIVVVWPFDIHIKNNKGVDIVGFNDVNIMYGVKGGGSSSSNYINVSTELTNVKVTNTDYVSYVSDSFNLNIYKLYTVPWTDGINFTS